MAHKLHQKIPLLVFGLVLAPLSISRLLTVKSMLATELAVMVTLFAGLLFVLGIIHYWRYA